MTCVQMFGSEVLPSGPSMLSSACALSCLTWLVQNYACRWQKVGEAARTNAVTLPRLRVSATKVKGLVRLLAYTYARPRRQRRRSPERLPSILSNTLYSSPLHHFLFNPPLRSLEYGSCDLLRRLRLASSVEDLENAISIAKDRSANEPSL